MSTRKTTVFYALLIAVASVAVGMVIASRLDLSSTSSAQAMAVPSVNSAPITGSVDASTFRNIAKAISPAVVNIRTESRQRATELSEFSGDELFERFFGNPRGGGSGGGQPPREQVAVAAGTGFVISREGLIITNNHVVEGATKIEVSFYGEDTDVQHEARLIGRDPLTDSALIELTEKPAHELTEVKFGDSSQMEPGDWVMAIGNPFGLSHTVSVGVVSANRAGGLPVSNGRWVDVIQTDAAINPGNSGGPLLNLRGEVVGINTAIYADSRQQGNLGIGFAIPSNIIRTLLPQLRGGKVTRGVIGVNIVDVPSNALAELGLKEKRGAIVSNVTGSGPASRAGIQPGDIILEFNGKMVRRRDELVEAVTNTKPGTTVPVKVLRGIDEKTFEEKTLNVTVDELNLEAEEGTRRPTQEPPDNAIEESKGFGLTLSALTPDTARRLRAPTDTEGVLVSDVAQGSTAARAGVVRGDIILQVNRRTVRSPQDASTALNQVRSGSTAFLLLLRNGQQTFVTVQKE
jgi:serine protease Do